MLDSSFVPSLARDPREILVLVGTRKGLYLFTSDAERASWARSGPYLAPCDVSHAVYDPRDGSIWAAANGDGARVYRSADLGRTWQTMGDPLPGELVWHVEPGRAGEPGVVYAGVMPAGLYRSRDGGESWQPVAGLNDHASRAEWWPGGGGLCLHTIMVPPERPGRLFAGISVAGLFRSDDDGATWTPANEGTPSFAEMWGQDRPDGAVAHPGVHRCVHKVVAHPHRPDTLFQQNHLGVFRSDDAGESWTDIGAGLPSVFGFPIAVGGGPEPTVFVIPEDGETIRTSYRLAVWRSVDCGASWIQGGEGLPAGEHNVLREGMAADRLTPTGVYVGTTAGMLYTSADGGQRWAALADDLPAVRSVAVA